MVAKSAIYFIALEVKTYLELPRYVVVGTALTAHTCKLHGFLRTVFLRTHYTSLLFNFGGVFLVNLVYVLLSLASQFLICRT